MNPGWDGSWLRFSEGMVVDYVFALVVDYVEFYGTEEVFQWFGRIR